MPVGDFNWYSEANSSKPRQSGNRLRRYFTMLIAPKSFCYIAAINDGTQTRFAFTLSWQADIHQLLLNTVISFTARPKMCCRLCKYYSLGDVQMCSVVNVYAFTNVFCFDLHLKQIGEYFKIISHFFSSFFRVIWVYWWFTYILTIRNNLWTNDWLFYQPCNFHNV